MPSKTIRKLLSEKEKVKKRIGIEGQDPELFKAPELKMLQNAKVDEVQQRVRLRCKLDRKFLEGSMSDPIRSSSPKDGARRENFSKDSKAKTPSLDSSSI